MTDTKSTPAAAPVSPTVKVRPDYQVGQKVIHSGEGTEHTILSITPDGMLRLSGCACLTTPGAVKPL